MTLNRFQINLLVIAGVYCGILFMLFVITDLVGPKRISFNGVLAIISTIQPGNLLAVHIGDRGLALRIVAPSSQGTILQDDGEMIAAAGNAGHLTLNFFGNF